MCERVKFIQMLLKTKTAPGRGREGQKTSFGTKLKQTTKKYII